MSLALVVAKRELIPFGSLRYGFFTTSNSYFICRDPAIIDQIFTTLRFGVRLSPSALLLLC